MAVVRGKEGSARVAMAITTRPCSDGGQWEHGNDWSWHHGSTVTTHRSMGKLVCKWARALWHCPVETPVVVEVLGWASNEWSIGTTDGKGKRRFCIV